MATEPTPRQIEILKTVARLEPILGRPPLATEVAQELGISRQALHVHLNQLRLLGLLEYQGRTGRNSVPLLSEAARRLLQPGFPVLGQIAAGPPGFADAFPEGQARNLADLLPLRPGDYLLRVAGDSMIGAGIYPGDHVAVRPDELPAPGEIAVVFLPGEETATLKRWYRQGEEVILIAENPVYPPMHFAAQAVRLQGVVIGHIGGRRPRRGL